MAEAHIAGLLLAGCYYWLLAYGVFPQFSPFGWHLYAIKGNIFFFGELPSATNTEGAKLQLSYYID